MPVSRWTLCATVLTLPTMLLATEPASAQVFYREWSYYGNVYPRPPALMRRAPLPPGEIIDIMAEDYRYRRIGQPQFAGHMYVVEGVDRHGAVVRSYVDAFNGRLIDVDVLRPATRPPGPGPRIARLPDRDDRPQVLPTPPRRPSEARPSGPHTRPDARPAPRQAARPPATTPVAPPATAPAVTAPSASPIVPLSREPRVVNPAEVRLPDEVDKAPPMARPPQPSPNLVAPSQPPQSSAPAPVVPRAAVPSPPAPGASQVAPAPLDDAVRQPSTPSGPAVPAAPLL